MDTSTTPEIGFGPEDVRALGRSGTRAACVWGALLVLVVVVGSATRGAAVARVALAAAALGEGLAGLLAVVRPRRAATLAGRTYSPAYHGVLQDFGFYNIGFAALLGAAALHPESFEPVVAVAVGMYLVHGATHLLRYSDRYFGGGAPIATRPKILELRDGLQLVAAAAGFATLFIPG